MFQEWLIMNEPKINHLYYRTEICSNSEIVFHPLCGSVCVSECQKCLLRSSANDKNSH